MKRDMETIFPLITLLLDSLFGHKVQNTMYELQLISIFGVFFETVELVLPNSTEVEPF